MDQVQPLPKKPDPDGSSNEASVRLIANFLRQIAGTDWSKKELKALADAVEMGARKVIYDEFL